jgi:4-diphosphocytidyl-2-C-methyl-D-erythritol kinase
VTRRLELLAPAKVNWTLEVLRKRPDGYHEIRSVLQTIGLCDIVRLTDADGIELVLSGDAGPLADEPPERNLAVRSARALQARIGRARGVRIEIEKHVPVAAGLGGGSSDAASVLRGLNVLWDARQDETNLVEIAGEIGSDPPFFVVCGTASVSGRGEVVRALPDAVATDLVLATPRLQHRGEKTAMMYHELTPSHYTDGEATEGCEEIVRAQRSIDDPEMANAFERVLAATMPETARAILALRDGGYWPHLAGSGPSFFLLLDADVDRDALCARIDGLGLDAVVTRTMTRDDALRIEAR